MAQTNIYEFAIPASARRAFKTISQHKLLEVERALVPVMKEILSDWMSDVVDLTIKDTTIKKHTGDLFKSLQDGPRVKGSSLDSIGGKYLGNEHANIQEYGGIILPSSARVLCIPMPAALRPDGTEKLKSPAAWSARYKTFSYQSKRTGKGYLAYKDSANNLVLLYVYAERVTLKPLLGLVRHHQLKLPELMQAWGQAMVRGMQSTNFYNVYVSPKKKVQWLEGDVKSVIRNFKPVQTY